MKLHSLKLALQEKQEYKQVQISMLKKNSSEWSKAKTGDNKFAIVAAHEHEANSASGMRGRQCLNAIRTNEECPEGAVAIKVKGLGYGLDLKPISCKDDYGLAMLANAKSNISNEGNADDDDHAAALKMLKFAMDEAAHHFFHSLHKSSTKAPHAGHGIEMPQEAGIVFKFDSDADFLKLLKRIEFLTTHRNQKACVQKHVAGRAERGAANDRQLLCKNAKASMKKILLKTSALAQRKKSSASCQIHARKVC